VTAAHTSLSFIADVVHHSDTYCWVDKYNDAESGRTEHFGATTALFCCLAKKLNYALQLGVI
jgi:hypothetical protein